MGGAIVLRQSRSRLGELNKLSLERKARAVLGRAVVYGHVAKAVELQGNRVIALFTSSDRYVQVPEFTAEVYQFLLCANQLTQLLSENSRPKMQFVSAEDLENTKHLRNIWEHSHPGKTRLSANWKPHNEAQESWLAKNFPGSWPEVYSIEEIDGEISIAGLLSVNLLVREAEFWVETSKDFDDPHLIWFPNQAL